MQNDTMFDWSDVRFFLAVAETGSTLAAGRRLRVSQTTAARRVGALEAALGRTLFERRQTGYALTPAGQALLPLASGMERAAQALADSVAAQDRELTGTVRLTTIEIYAVTVLQPILHELHAAHPAIRIELETSETVLDLASGAADVALRRCDRPEGAGLFARRIVDDRWTVYCSRGYAADRGRPARRSELRGHQFVGGGEEGVWEIYRAWLSANGLEDAVSVRHASSTGLLAAAKSGFGLAVLPCLVADRDPDLVRCLPPSREPVHGLWLVTHERVRRAPHVRAVIDLLGERLAALAGAGGVAPAVPT